MPILQFNEQLATVWQLLPCVATQKLAALADTAPVASSGVSITGLQAAMDLTAPPSFTELTATSLRLAMPDETMTAWSAQVTGFLSGKLLGQTIVDNKPISVDLSNVR